MYEEVFDSTQDLFADKIANMNIPIKWKVVHTNLKIKKDGSIGEVILINQKMKNITDYDLLIIINDDIFNRLDDKYQLVMADRLLAKVNYDFEKSQLKSATPDFKEFTGVLERHTYDMITATISETKRIASELKEEKQGADGKDID